MELKEKVMAGQEEAIFDVRVVYCEKIVKIVWRIKSPDILTIGFINALNEDLGIDVSKMIIKEKGI